MDFFRNINISPSSFWLGFISGLLFLWILFRLRIIFPKIVNFFRVKLTNLHENLSTNADVRLRNDVYRFSQKQHIAASLFSLDEIAIEPKVLTPLIHIPSTIDFSPTDSISLTVPYIPDWPELAAIYNASTMTLLQALQGGGNIILAGHPGSGKTVALAWLAAKLARNDKGLERLSGYLPLYVHATGIPHLLDLQEIPSVSDLQTEPGNNPASKLSGIKNTEEVINLFIQAISDYASQLTIGNLPKVVNNAIESHKAILIVDRVDELSPVQAREVTEYLRLIITKYPTLQIITAMAYDNLANLPSLGFSLLGLAAWGEVERANLVRLWGNQWTKWISPLGKSTSQKIQSYFLKNWLCVENQLLKPVEYTLKVWAAFAGDILGDDALSSIDSYIRRMTDDHTKNRQALEQFALHQLIAMDYLSKPEETVRVISEAYKHDMSSELSRNKDNSPKPFPDKLDINNISSIDTLINNGFLVNHQGSRYGFAHSVIAGFLAGKALFDIGLFTTLQEQPSWLGKNLAMYYFAQYGDVTPLIQHLLQEDDVFHSNQLLIARWLQIAPKNRPWRTILLRTLATVLQKEKDTLNLAAKILAAMAFSGDSGVSVYFRQLLKSDHPHLKLLGALGCGIMADGKAYDDLSAMVQEQSPASIRSASLSLAAIGDKQSLELLASNLLNGSELNRRYAAEALANNHTEGYLALKEGSGMDDLLVRRSVIFGLIRIDDKWSREIVEKLQLEDNEWVVRNAAIQAFDELAKKIDYAPTPIRDLTEAQWLIDFATRNATTVAPGKPALDLVKKALSNGTDDEKLLAMDYLRRRCDRSSLELIYHTHKNSSDELRELSYFVLWLMVCSGIHLPFSFE